MTKNRIRYQKFKKGTPIIELSPIQIIGYVLFLLVLFLSASTFSGCTTAKVSTVIKVERLDVDSTGTVFNLKYLRK